MTVVRVLFCSFQCLRNEVMDTLYVIISHIYHLHVPNLITFTTNLKSTTNCIYHLHVPCIGYYITFTANQYQLFITFTACMLCCVYMYIPSKNKHLYARFGALNRTRDLACTYYTQCRAEYRSNVRGSSGAL